MCASEKPSIFRRISIGTAFAALLLPCTAWIAKDVFLSILGEMVSHRHLVESLSTPVPIWESWSVQGARQAQFLIDPVLGLGLGMVWAGVMWRAGLVRAKLERSLWLFIGLAIAAAVIGAGDSGLLAAPVAGVFVAWGLAKLSGVQADSHSGAFPLKPLWVALTLGGLAWCGIVWAWDEASLANPIPSVLMGVFQLALSGTIGLFAAYWITGLGVQSHALSTWAGWRGITAAAVMAGSLYVGTGFPDLKTVWSARFDSVSKLLESPARKSFRRELSAYRLTPHEAAAVRMARAELSTKWEDAVVLKEKARGFGADGAAVSLWLSADVAVFSPAKAGEREAARISALRDLNAAPEKGVAWVGEMAGWFYLDGGQPEAAVAAFHQSLRAEPANAMAWYGLAKAELGRQSGEPHAVEALAQACLLEPRMMFSPALLRPPFSSIREVALRHCEDSVLTLEKAGMISAGDVARHRRYVSWRAAWDRAQGRVANFLNDTGSPAPVVGSVACVRNRLNETLAKPNDDKIAAIFGSGVALLTDRHFNIGQAHRLFARCQKGGEVWSEPKGEHILISRPLMAGWPSTFTEGGVGSTLGEFEENLVIRLTCYGWEDAPVKIDESWLRRQLPAE